MKTTSLKSYLRDTLSSFKSVVIKYPVEMAIAVWAFIALIICHEHHGLNEAWIAGPHLFALAYIFNNLFSQGRQRFVYYLSLLLVVPVLFIEIDDWALSGEYFVELVCLLLAVPVAKRYSGNQSFVAGNWWLFSGIAVAIILSTIAWLLFRGLIFATSELFGFDWYYTRAGEYFVYFSYTVAFALLSLSYIDRHEGRVPERTGVMSVLLDYILTPALLAFNALFYAYLIKIIVEWSLPQGYVATMVFVFSLLAFSVKALRELLPEKRYSWYYDNLSYIAIPAVVLFWAGVIYRLYQYGFTESRVYLLLCGVIMTTSLALFACKGEGRYGRAWILAIVLLGTFTFIRPVNAARIGIWSQEKRVIRLASELNLLLGDKRLKEVVELGDTEPGTIAKLEQLREALTYLKRNGGNDYGIDYPYSYGTEYGMGEDDGRIDCIYADKPMNIFDTEGISHLIRVEPRYNESEYVYVLNSDYLCIFWNGQGVRVFEETVPGIPEDILIPMRYTPVWFKPASEIAGYLLDKLDTDREELRRRNFYLTDDEKAKLSVYEDRQLKLLFTSLNIEFTDNGVVLSNNFAIWLFIKN